MDIETLSRFFMWCTVLNFGLLLLSYLYVAFAGDSVYKTHSKRFPMQRETFNAVLYSCFGIYKIAWLVFCAVPWLVLEIIG
ncbi:MAG: hypothetical protein PHR35_21885 [Kiritimatiellae bacterium]|nr:hypothetical protein [Kiritimatiellia bacterium]